MKIDVKELLKIEDDKQRYNQSIKLFDEARRDVTRRVREAIQENNYKITRIAAEIGVDAGGISRRIRNDSTTFSLPAPALVKFSRIYMKMSCHELFFDSRGISELPNSLSVMLKYIMSGSEAQRDEILAFIAQRYENALANNELRTDVKSYELMRERILEQAGDRYIQPVYLFGSSAPAALKNAVKRYMDPEIEQAGNLSSIMYYAASLGTSLDYFLAVDYTPFTELKLFGDDDGQIIEDEELRDFVSKYLLLPPGAQTEVFKFIMKNHWSA